LREKDLTSEATTSLVRHGVTLSRKTGKIFLVNSHTRIALAEGADGVHLTSTQNVGEVVRARGRSEFLIGKSVHSFEEARQAEVEGADYVLLGPVFDPLSKERQMAPLGLNALRDAVERLRIPVFALGGVDKQNAEEVLKTGVAGIAGISWARDETKARFTDHKDTEGTEKS